MTRTIVVRFRRAGWHHWPAPTKGREYLGASHRHVFHVEVQLTVGHDDREVEFHDLLERAEVVWPNGVDLGPQSCETLATGLARRLRAVYTDRAITVSVFEDGENGAVLSWSASEPV